MPLQNKPPVSFAEYERLFRTIHAIVANEDVEPSRACVFFAVVGAYLLSKHHGLSSAKPMAGFAGYNLRLPTNLVLVLGSIAGGEPISDQDAFHCWIEVDGYIVDLTAPLFDQMAPEDRKGARVPPMQFQKPTASGIQTIEHLNTAGAHMHVRNPSLMAALMTRFLSRPVNTDLANICTGWYVRPPKKMSPRVGVGDQHGNAKFLEVSRIQLEGAW